MPKEEIENSDGETVEAEMDPVDTSAYPVNHNVAVDGPLPEEVQDDKDLVRATKPTRTKASGEPGMSKAQREAAALAEED